MKAKSNLISISLVFIYEEKQNKPPKASSYLLTSLILRMIWAPSLHPVSFEGLAGLTSKEPASTSREMGQHLQRNYLLSSVSRCEEASF